MEGEKIAGQEVIAFSSIFRLERDTIYLSDSILGVITGLYRSRSGNNEFTFRSLATGKPGTYYDFGDPLPEDTTYRIELTPPDLTLPPVPAEPEKPGSKR